MLALRALSTSSRGGPSLFANEPVAVQLLEWHGTEQAPHAQDLLARLPALSPLLRWAPHVAAQIDPVHTLCDAIAVLARFLLNGEAGLLEAAYSIPLKDRKWLVVVGARDVTLSHRALGLARELLTHAADPRPQVLSPSLRDQLEQLRAEADAAHPDEDHRALTLAARKLDIPVVPTADPRLLSFGWGAHGRSVRDLLPAPAPVDADSTAYRLLVADGKLIAATQLGSPRPRNALPRVHPAARAHAEQLTQTSGSRIAAWRCGSIAQQHGPWFIDSEPSLALHVSAGADPVALGTAVLGPDPGRIPLVLAIGSDAALSQMARAWQVESRRLGMKGASVCGPGFSALGAEELPSPQDPIDRTRQFLLDRDCESLVVGATASELLSRGLPVDRALVCVLVESDPAAEPLPELMRLLEGRKVARQIVRARDTATAIRVAAQAFDAQVRAPARAPQAMGPRAAELPADVGAVQRHELTDGPCVFSVMRNEAYLLPHFLAHYRRLGVENFVFYDDNSTDASREILAGQSDCTVFVSPRRFEEKLPGGRAFHHFLKEAVPESLGPSRWVLGVDLDEFLVLPPGFDALAPFQHALDDLGHECVFGTMVDMHPATLAKRNYPGEHSPFEGSPYFDVQRGFHRRADGSSQKMLNGVRGRLIDRLRRVAPEAHHAIFAGRGYLMPALYKVPLARTGRGITRHNSHTVNRRPPQGIEIALAHFKFGPDLDGKIRDALATNAHYLDSIEYRFLEAALRLLADEDLRYEGTRSAADANAMAEAGLVRFEA